MVGKGAYGAVYQGRHRATGHVVALKIINLDTEDDDVSDIQKEVSLLQQLMKSFASGPGGNGGVGYLPNVIKYYGSMMEGPKVWIIMEFAEGGSIRTLVSPVRWPSLTAVSCPTTQGAPHCAHYARGACRASVPAQERYYPS